jgi:hypothetical protein
MGLAIPPFDKTQMKCALCHKGLPTEDGHIIPHFVFCHIIKTSLTGFIGTQENPNKRIQDGKTRSFLCASCEDSFGNSEKAFAEKVFHPLHKHQAGHDSPIWDDLSFDLAM